MCETHAFCMRVGVSAPWDSKNKLLSKDLCLEAGAGSKHRQENEEM